MTRSFIDKYADGEFNMLLWCPSCKSRCVFQPPPFSDIGGDYMICTECAAQCSWTALAMEKAKSAVSPW